MDHKTENQLQVLKELEEVYKEHSQASSLDLSHKLGWDHNKFVGIMKSLETLGKVKTTAQQVMSWTLTKEGTEYMTSGSPEYKLIESLKQCDHPVSVAELKSQSIGLNILLKNKWASSNNGQIELKEEGKKLDRDITQEQLKLVSENDANPTIDSDILQVLSRRKLIVKSTFTAFQVEPTSEFSTVIEKLETDLTKDMLTSGSWKTAKFKAYNFNAAGLPPSRGTTHPLVQTSNMFRNVLVQMGFEEMPTRRWVESSFWNFDALFQPQSHPVRDSHDTFFMKNPKVSCQPTADSKGNLNQLFEVDYFNRVKNMHEIGDENSLGWQCEWKSDEAFKLIMRTHTTGISSQMLRQLGKEYEETGVLHSRRFFSIDRVFRNETLDATHLAEFHQVEGVVAEKGASLASLMGVIKTFFHKIGITNIKFKPAYNPYTEPSMEIFGYHPLLKKWTEIGNSGVFRPEMLVPMGLPADMSVLGWGLSVERPTMISNNVKDIRELFGPKARLDVF